MGLVSDLKELLGRLEGEGVPHMLVGGIALEAYGVPRSTLDVDLQVSLERPPSILHSSFLGWRIEERTRDPVFGQDVLILHRPHGDIPFELFLTTHWFTRQALDRRTQVASALLERDVPVPQREDFVLLKASFRAWPERSPRKAAQDALDIEAVAARGPLDLPYLEANARKLGTWEALAPFLPGSRP